MMEGDLGLPTKLAGLGWSRTIFFKAGLAAASQKPRKVRLTPALSFDKQLNHLLG